MKLKNQKGAAMVEFAIVLPLLFTIVFGIIEFSLILYDKAMITNASREGARVGIVYDFPTRTSVTDIQNKVSSYLTGHLITFGGSNAWTTGVTGQCVNAGDSLAVTVSYPYQYLVLPNFVTSLTGNINLSAVTTMRCE